MTVDLPSQGPRAPGLPSDQELVERILGGDRAAVGDLYDRYADRIHTMAAHMLRDADEAADVTGQVFLVAMERLHQLREPSKVRPWLYAICRNEIYRRSRHRSRVRPVEELDEMQTATADRLAPGDLGDDHDHGDDGVDPALLAGLVQDAAAGLDDRDRMVLELNLTEGLDGDDLADALGVSVDNAYQLTHRMKERFERSLSALLVVRAGRGLCTDLDGVAEKWDGRYDVLWRKRFARHVDRCERCDRMRSKLPKAVLAGAALSQAAQSAVLAAPISIREQVVSQAAANVATATGSAWSPSGFPVASRRRWPWRALAAVGLVLVVTFGVAAGLGPGERTVVEGDEAPPAATSTTTTPPEVTSTTVVPGDPTTVPGAPGGTTPGTTAPTTTVAGTAPPTTPPAPSTTVPPTTTTTVKGGDPTSPPATTTTTPTRPTASTTTTTIRRSIPPVIIVPTTTPVP